jgi:hypothetical protein
MCCGNRRSAWRNTLGASPQASTIQKPTGNLVSSPAPAPAEPAPGNGRAWGQLTPVPLHCTAQLPLRIWGAVTGRAYEFSDAEAVQPVDPRDAAILTRGYLFRRAAV